MSATLKGCLGSGKRLALLSAVLLCILPLPQIGAPFGGDALLGAAAAYAQDDCSGSAMNEITAAFNTQGFWVQADLIYQMANTDLGLIAPLLYILTVFFGLLMIALGAPPKLYLWWIMGPALYHWLIFTPTEEGRKATCWKVATKLQDMSHVWRLSEVGLLNLNYIMRENVTVSKDAAPSATAKEVALIFAWFDEVVSAQIDYIVGWSGIHSQRKNPGSNTNTHHESGDDSDSPSGGSGDGSEQDTGKDRAWAILSNSKWPMLENISGATLHNQDLRNAFVRMMASECGDIIAKNIDRAALASAGAAKGEKLPATVFKKDVYESGGGGSGSGSFAKQMASKFIPMPQELVTLLGDKEDTAFRNFDTNYFGNSADKVKDLKVISCKAYFYTIIQGFRWEAGLAYNQAVGGAADSKIKAETVVYDFLYGWRVGFGDAQQSPQLEIDKQIEFVQNLILLSLLRNELALAPNPVDQTYSSAVRNENYVKAYARNVGSKSKFGELYMWAKLMPFLQGVLLYILAAAYPFACVLIVIPGWHKALLTWMGFYAWAKSWDAGFAFVMSLERNIWAMLGNTSQAARFNAVVHEMSEFGKIDINGGETDKYMSGANCSSAKDLLGCLVPKVTTGEHQGFKQATAIFDKGLIMATNMDLDLTNAYYIYLMSALYFAVPAVTGQVLLGAKSGASGLISTAIGGTAQEVGKAGGNAYVGEAATKGHHAMATVGQEAFAKSMRGSGLAGKWLATQNAATAHDIDSSRHQAAGALSELGGIAMNTAAGGRRAGIDAVMGAARKGRSWLGGGAGPMRGAGDPAGVGGKGPWGKAVSALGEGVDVGGLAATYELGAATTKGALDYNTARSAHQVASWAAGAAGKAEQVAGQRFQAFGQQQAAEAQWRAMRNLASQYSGQTAALGVFAGAYTAGPKPMHIDGMAGMGMLNSYASDGQAAVGGDAMGRFFYPMNELPRYNRARHGYLQGFHEGIAGWSRTKSYDLGTTAAHMAGAAQRGVRGSPSDDAKVVLGPNPGEKP